MSYRGTLTGTHYFSRSSLKNLSTLRAGFLFLWCAPSVAKVSTSVNIGTSTRTAFILGTMWTELKTTNYTCFEWGHFFLNSLEAHFFFDSFL